MKIEYLNGIIEVTASRKYKINFDFYEHGEIQHWIKVQVSADTDRLALAEQLQDELDTLQSPDLFRMQDAITEKDKKDKRSIVHSLVG